MSNDLISRNRLKEVIDINFYGTAGAKVMMQVIDEAPTAYDVDKVVEEIKELRSNPDLYVYGVDAYTNAIDIVRKGGVDNG